MCNQRIEVEISGGIGNQLFQYASAWALSRRLQAELILDVSWYERIVPSIDKRDMKLDDILNLGNVKRIKSNVHPKIKRALKRAKCYKVISDVSTSPQAFTSLSTRRHIQMLGYWQSEQYFVPVADLLRSSFLNNLTLSSFANEMADQIRSSSSLGLHVRRGDYVTHHKTKSFHGLCEKEYFIHAISNILKSAKIDKLYIFSDDIHWCKENLSFDIPSVFIESSVSDTEQLKLMSLCCHHVISNSSFSWWAAWFGYSEDQVVIYPNVWFADGSSLEHMPPRWKPL